MKSFELPEHLHSLAKICGLEPKINTLEYKTTLFVSDDERPAAGTTYKGFTVIKETHIDDEELVIGVVKYMAHVGKQGNAGWTSAASEAEAVALVPEAFVKWAKEQKRVYINQIAIHKDKIEIMEDFVKGLSEFGIS